MSARDRCGEAVTVRRLIKNRVVGGIFMQDYVNRSRLVGVCSTPSGVLLHGAHIIGFRMLIAYLLSQAETDSTRVNCRDPVPTYLRIMLIEILSSIGI
jgi:hypothetical protein